MKRKMNRIHMCIWALVLWPDCCTLGDRRVGVIRLRDDVHEILLDTNAIGLETGDTRLHITRLIPCIQKIAMGPLQRKRTSLTSAPQKKNTRKKKTYAMQKL